MNFKIKKTITNILIVIFSCVFLWSGYCVYAYVKEYNELNETYQCAQELVQIGEFIDNNDEPSPPTTASQISNNQCEIISETNQIDEYKDIKIDIAVDWNSLSSQSKDVVGWIYIPDTNINYPLVHRDNEYYLNRDYTGKWNSGGSIFIDQNQTIDSQNVIIYGHNMKADIMFHRLPYYADQEYANDHKYIYIVTNNETRVYQVFSVVYADASSDTYETNFDENGMDFSEYADRAINNSIIITDIKEIEEYDNIISLSTCTGRTKTERLIVHAVLLTTY